MSGNNGSNNPEQPRQPRSLQGLLKFAMEGEKIVSDFTTLLIFDQEVMKFRLLNQLLN
jgi:hypothetical protein